MKNLIFRLFMSFYVEGFGQISKDSSIVDKSFYILQKPQKEYTGTFKNGIPYEGFFKIKKQEWVWVDFYEKGVKKYQYSNDYLKNMEKPSHILDIQSKYENGKIIDGEEYKHLKKAFLTKKIVKGNLESFMVDLFAVHYFNRITFKIQKDTILITNLDEEKALTKIYFKDKKAVTELFNAGKIVYYVEQINNELENLPANSTVSCNNISGLVRCVASKNMLNEQEASGELKINLTLIETIDFSDKNNVKDLFEYMVAFWEQEDSVRRTYINEENEKNAILYMAYLTTDDKGKIIKGVVWKEAKSTQKAFYKLYDKGKVTNQAEKTLQDFQAVFMKYLESRF